MAIKNCAKYAHRQQGKLSKMTAVLPVVSNAQHSNVPTQCVNDNMHPRRQELIPWAAGRSRAQGSQSA